MLSTITSREEYLGELPELLEDESILLARTCNRVSWLGQFKLICLCKWQTLSLKCCELYLYSKGKKKQGKYMGGSCLPHSRAAERKAFVKFVFKSRDYPFKNISHIFNRNNLNSLFLPIGLLKPFIRKTCGMKILEAFQWIMF